MAISAKSLFHFTSKPEYLISILENGFFPRYSLEDSKFKYSPSCAIPMVCFCDLPLSDVSDHIGFYGNYGLGLKKEWAIDNGINPVLYLSNVSQLSKCLEIIGRNTVGVYANFQRALIDGLASDDQINAFINEYGKYAMEIEDYIKPIEGKMYKDGKEINKYFYDEREWRYIPQIETDYQNYRLSKEDYHNSIKLAQANAQLSKKCNLKFKIDDIKYIILSSENDVYSTIEAINEIYAKESLKSKSTLCSRILTVNQIKEDI
jgi:hypothetical protein